MLNEALDYAARGWAVFPIKPRSKVPATNNGFKDATTNPATIRRWFERYDHNLGIRTGMASGIIVLDVDGEIGAGSLRELIHKHGPLPATAIAATGRPGGRHLYFRCTAEIGNSESKVGPKLDIRGDGGYVVGPPSVHENGNRYRWLNDLAPAPVPAWLIRLAQRPAPRPPVELPRRTPTPAAGGNAYGKAALEGEISALTLASSGSRNAALNKASYALHQLVATGELNAAEVEHRLLLAAQANELLHDDGLPKVMATIRSGARAGLQQPRKRRRP